jgi:hypothetical protein
MGTVRHATYVVYPAALFDGWEVVRDGDVNPVFFDERDAAISYARVRALREGGATVRLENWYGDSEGTMEVHPLALEV